MDACWSPLRCQNLKLLWRSAWNSYMHIFMCFSRPTTQLHFVFYLLHVECGPEAISRKKCICIVYWEKHDVENVFEMFQVQNKAENQQLLCNFVAYEPMSCRKKVFFPCLICKVLQKYVYFSLNTRNTFLSFCLVFHFKLFKFWVLKLGNVLATPYA